MPQKRKWASQVTVDSESRRSSLENVLLWNGSPRHLVDKAATKVIQRELMYNPYIKTCCFVWAFRGNHSRRKAPPIFLAMAMGNETLSKTIARS